MPQNLIPAGIFRIVPDEFGAWYVVDGRNKFGWLFGSRAEAIRERDLLQAQAS